MKSFTQKWAIISLIEEAKEGSEFYYTEFPLHITLAGIFAVHSSGQQLAEGLAELLNNQGSVEIEADDKDMFGPGKNIAVMKIKKTQELMKLYDRIQDWLQQLGVEYNSPEYQGSGYLPHATFQKTGKLTKGEKLTLGSVSIVDLFPNRDGYQRKILKTICLH